MQNIPLKGLLAAFLLFAFSSHAQLYKGFDDKGNVFYSDKPFDNAERFSPPPLSIIDAPKVRPEPTVKEEEELVEFKYTEFDIIAPKNNEIIWNEPAVTVSLNLKPALNAAQGHNIWLMMNGKPLIENSQSMVLSIGRLDRGSHQLQAYVKNKQGETIVRSRTIVVHIKHTGIPGEFAFPARPGLPGRPPGIPVRPPR